MRGYEEWLACAPKPRATDCIGTLEDFEMFKRANLLSNRRTRRRMGFVALAMLLTCLLVPSLFAQTDTGAITGTATDATGAVVPGASVTATNTGTGLKLTAVTGSAGEFKILAVPRGDYTVVVSAKGFADQTANVTITVSTTQEVLFQLQPSGTTSTVTVTAEAPLVNSSDATIGATIQGEQVTDLPLDGRNFTQLALLTPGVTRGAYGDIASGGGSSNSAETIRNNESGNAALSINGLRPQANNYILDGVDNNDGLINGILFFPNVDATQEFKVNTSLAPAEYGRAGGPSWSVLSSRAPTSITVRPSVLSRQELRLEPQLPVQRRSGVRAGRLPAATARLRPRRSGPSAIEEQAFHLRRLPGAARNHFGSSHYLSVPTALMRTGISPSCRMPAKWRRAATRPSFRSALRERTRSRATPLPATPQTGCMPVTSSIPPPANPSRATSFPRTV